MFLAGMNQQAVASTESVKSVSHDHAKRSEQASPAQANESDSVTISIEALERSGEASTEMDFKGGDSNAGQEQESSSVDTSLIDVLA